MTRCATLSAVSVVLATRGRPQLLRAAIRSIFAQTHQQPIEVIVVFDRSPIDSLDDVAVPALRTLRTVGNTRTPGLAGGRNTGILLASHDLIAFCDDDDEWLPEKLVKQLQLLERQSKASLVATGIRVRTAGADHDRIPPARARHADFLASRITEIHPSSFLLRRQRLVDEIGLVDEELPAAYGEDYDLLLRASALAPVLSVPEPLVIVNWNRTSFFADRWQGIADGLSYVLAKFPSFGTSRRGSARIEGQIAFAHAALGHRAEALRWAVRTLRHDLRQVRAYAAMFIAIPAVPAAGLVGFVNSRGRGL
ncbi:MAG: glycosyltransferase family 2 protein [Actinomycetota bacterium]|nr:glycosyltransferase family 2 protein [Actinomycetota bacterium]